MRVGGDGTLEATRVARPCITFWAIARHLTHCYQTHLQRPHLGMNDTPYIRTTQTPSIHCVYVFVVNVKFCFSLPEPPLNVLLPPAHIARHADARTAQLVLRVGAGANSFPGTTLANEANRNPRITADGRRENTTAVRLYGRSALAHCLHQRLELDVVGVVGLDFNREAGQGALEGLLGGGIHHLGLLEKKRKR